MESEACAGSTSNVVKEPCSAESFPAKGNNFEKDSVSSKQQGVAVEVDERAVIDCTDLSEGVSDYNAFILECPICKLLFVNEMELKDHTLTHFKSIDPANVTEQCGGTILKKRKKTSIRSSFKCSFCGKGFGKKLDLACHEGIHTGERPHVCVICDKGFPVRKHLSGHYRKVHQNETCPENVQSNEIFTCSECRREFTRKGDLTQHKKKEHSSEAFTRFQCAFCEEEFLRKSDLICHEGTHTGGKPFSCFYCDDDFATKAGLKEHTQLHHPIDIPALKRSSLEYEKASPRKTEERKDASKNISKWINFKCKVCSKTFTKKADLSCHEGIHTGKRPYPCEMCGKGFATKQDLTKHKKRTHSKNFTCSLCEKGFGISSDLARHMKSHEK